jgi:hypothetical protein
MLSNIEKGCFLTLFIRDGYVLDFSTADFDNFTKQSVGIPLCNHYGKSKGKSLAAYINGANDADAKILLFDLLEYYETYFGPEYDPEQKDDFQPHIHKKGMLSNYLKCRGIADREQSSNAPFAASADYLKASFDSKYMSEQIDLLMRMRTVNPTDAIGKSKDLIESCCKTILESQGVEYNKRWSVAQLVKETSKVLNIDGNSVDTDEAGEIVKKILGGLQGIASGIAELRNRYGAGHGKSASFEGLQVRHAKLAVGSAVTLVEYLWEAYEWRKQQGKVQ